jgi:hypothetical protein
MIFLFDEKNEPKDIFADIPSEKPVDRPTMSLQSPGASSASPAAPGVVRQAGTFSKKLIFIPVVILILGGAAYAAYSYLVPKVPTVAPTAVVPDQGTPSVVAPEPVTNAPTPVTPTTPPTAVPPPPAAVLNTAPTAATGTSPLPPTSQPLIPEAGTSTPAVSSATLSASSTLDSDGDGLTDYQEVCIYGTDPHNPDTDGDGYQDGAEVKSGYNPNGPGKLTLPLPTISNDVCQRVPSPTTH